MLQLLPHCVLCRAKAWRDHRRCRLRHQHAVAHLISLAAELSSRCLQDIQTLDDWERERPILRQQLLWMLGLDPLPVRVGLNAQITGVVERPTYRIEKLVFESQPGLLVTANLYVPANASQPVPCVIYLCGHWPQALGAKVGYQDRYLWYPAHGFACLVVDPLGFGEIPGIHHGTNQLNFWHWLSLGYTPAGVEVWNAMRALDWLETRPEVDATRVGVTGISGGGVMTQYFAALDDRVAAAGPSCSTYTTGTQVAANLIPQQCDCTFYPNIFGMDFPIVAALVAPRPLIIFGGRKDPIFPPAGFREAFRRAKWVYDLYGAAPDGSPRIRLVESPSGHTDPPEFLRECRLWMMKWLQVEPERALHVAGDEAPSPEPPETLACIESMPATATNFHVHQTWIKVQEPRVPEDAVTWEKRRQEITIIIKDQVFWWFPNSEMPYRAQRLRNSGGYAGEFATFGEYEFETEPGVTIRAHVLRPKSQASPAPLLVWVKRPSEHVSFPDLDEFLPLVPSTTLLILTPRFADRPLAGSEFSRIERTAALTGRTVAANRVWDVLRAIAWVGDEFGVAADDVEVYGRGEAGVIGLYAAILESRIQHLILRDPPGSHRHGPALLTILRHTDIPQVAGAIAPRRLSFLEPLNPAFEWTRRAYELVGAGESFSVTASLAEAVLKARVVKKRGLSKSWPLGEPLC